MPAKNFRGVTHKPARIIVRTAFYAESITSKIQETLEHNFFSFNNRNAREVVPAVDMASSTHSEGFACLSNASSVYAYDESLNILSFL